jgi:hypothetical protein
MAKRAKAEQGRRQARRFFSAECKLEALRRLERGSAWLRQENAFGARDS